MPLQTQILFSDSITVEEEESRYITRYTVI